MKLKIVQAGDPVLRERGRELTKDEIKSPEVQRLIDLMRDASGRDWILRIAHGEGQTILTLNREPGSAPIQS